MATISIDAREEKIVTIEALDAEFRWLSAWIIHNANHLRESAMA